MIRVADPAKIGLALADIRALLGYNRRQLARAIAEATGRHEGGVYRQIQEWDRGIHSPTARALGPVLAELGYHLALVAVPDEDDRRDTGTGWPA